MYPLERYSPKTEPTGSTATCPICLVDQKAFNEFDLHVSNCYRKQTEAAATKAFYSEVTPQMATPCDWKPSVTKMIPCGKTFTDTTADLLHILRHTYRNAIPVCRYGSCADIWPITKRPHYDTREEWLDHIAEAHGLTYVKPLSLVFWCAFCSDYVYDGIRGPAARSRHYAGHMNEAIDAVTKYGYNGVTSTASGDTLLCVRHPFFCIFCFHDDGLSPSARLAVCNEGGMKGYPFMGQREHLRKHIRDVDGNTPCPASARSGATIVLCSSNLLYDPMELNDHLINEHKLFMLKEEEMGPPPKRVRTQGKALEALKRAKAEAEKEEAELEELGETDLEDNLSD